MLLHKVLYVSLAAGVGLFLHAFTLTPVETAASSMGQEVSVELSASITTVKLPCLPGTFTVPDCKPTDTVVNITATPKNFRRRKLLYTYTTTGGRTVGEGSKVTWDLSGVQPGTYTLTVEVEDDRNHRATASITVTVEECRCSPPACASINMECPTEPVKQGNNATVSVSLAGVPEGANVSYNWTVSAGKIVSGQGTPTITIDTKDQGDNTITAMVDLWGIPPECSNRSSCVFSVTR